LLEILLYFHILRYIYTQQYRCKADLYTVVYIIWS